MKDFKDYMANRVYAEYTITVIKDLLAKEVIVEGLKNFLAFMKSNSTDGFTFSEDDKGFTITIGNSKGVRVVDFSAYLVNESIPNNIVMLEDFNEKNRRVRSFLEYIEETMLETRPQNIVY